MKLNAKKIDVDNTFNAEEFGMETTDPAVIQMLLENVYPDPYVWPRELLANWFDAGGGGELILPDPLDPNWSIEDFGEGMTDEFMAHRYTKIFSSTKRDSDKDIGGFGHGRLSPLAYTDTFTVRSRFKDENGTIMEGNYIVFKGEHRIPKIARVSFAPSETQQTGVKVTIPIGDTDIARINKRTRFFASYLPNPPQGFETIKYDFKNEVGAFRTHGQDEEMRGVRLIVGGVPYPVPTGVTNMHRDLPFDIFFKIGEVQPTIDRGNINGDAATLEEIKNRYNKLIENYRDGVQKEVLDQPTLLESFAKFTKISNQFQYGIRNLIFPTNFSEPFSKLPISDIFKAAKGDFNLHQIVSKTDKYTYEELDLETKTFKSLTGLRIKDLSSGGIAQRRAGIEYRNHAEDGISLVDYMTTRNHRITGTEVRPQIAIFAIKNPYVAGQIRLIKEAIAAKLTEMRTPDTAGNAVLGSRATALLIQYDDEEDVKRIANIISPNIPVTIITDSSKRSTAQRYLTVIANEKGSYSRTKPMKVKDLSLPNTLFMVRDPKWTAYDIHAIMENLRKLDFLKEFRFISIQKPDMEYLPEGYQTIEGVIHQHLKKKFGYTLDVNTVLAHVRKVETLAETLDAGILKYPVQDNKVISLKKPLWQALKENQALKDDEELHAVIKMIEEKKTFDSKEAREILTVVTYIERLKVAGFFIKPPVGGNRSLPILPEIQQDTIKKLNDKYPLLKALTENYQYRSYGIPPIMVEGIKDYMEAKNRNCKNDSTN